MTPVSIASNRLPARLPQRFETEEPAAASGLSQAIDQVIAGDDNMRSAHWGLVIQDDKGKVVYSHDGDKLFTPASNMKMVTGAAALKALGANAHFTTKLANDGSIDAGGTLHGNLYLVGGGDPSLETADLRAAVAASGVKKVDGNVIVDDHCFDDKRFGRGWAWDDFNANFSAEIDGLTLDENVATLHVSSKGVSVEPNVGYLSVDNHVKSGAGTELDVERELGGNRVDVSGTVAANDPRDVEVTVHDPALYAGTVLKSLAGASGEVRRGAPPADAHPLWSKQSPTLLELEKHMLKASDNLYAESIFRALNNGQSDTAPDKEKQLLGLTSPSRIVDGSGLSHAALLSPSLLSDVGQKNYRDPGARDCLPVAGVDGTLKHRMASMKGRVQAKTGTMGGVSSLSGWLNAKDGHQYSFAWIVNDYPAAIGGAKHTEDALLSAIDGAIGH